MSRPIQKLLTTKALVARANERGIPLTLTRVHKDSMERDGKRIAPSPVKRLGKNNLYTEAQADAYFEKILINLQPESEKGEAA